MGFRGKDLTERPVKEGKETIDVRFVGIVFWLRLCLAGASVVKGNTYAK